MKRTSITPNRAEAQESTAGNREHHSKREYHSPELRVYGDVYERTNTSWAWRWGDWFIGNDHTTT